ncbi:NUDIX domain-containing protein [Mucilaginibacter sp. RB4R14]|uniref:NUDIX domain-containing protein n=1 Tax=Mucilaginibacter aurantiaciroseus TaxID=2949308 RepID=UPI0020912D66|nr:NUDIX domain-containing protein [Mucilaginibacter aurantiaciroseus]MCO5935237.1 NUDIX domain-containing protein [Mucilaginibacter aurantiaciroseus]
MNNKFFNVRVYGLLINANNEVLISDEQEYGFRFTKFPGGGLEYGEGLIEGLKREFVEECNTEVEVTSHFYTTDFFVKSAFNDSQIISVYYLVKAVSDLRVTTKIEVFDFEGEGDILQSFRCVKLSELNVDAFTFPTDQYVADLLLKTL